MSDRNHFALTLIVDRSASMAPFRTAMQRGIRNIISEQVHQVGLTTVTLVEFDDEVVIRNVMDSPASVDFRLEPRGRTALYDAIGIGVVRLQHEIRGLPEHARPAQVQVVVVTDGAENASTEFSQTTLRALVNHQRHCHDWDFRLFAANQDAALTGKNLGFGDDGFTFEADLGGVERATGEMSDHVTKSRSRGPQAR